MNRKDFLKGLGLVGLTATSIPILNACSNDDGDSTTSTQNNDIDTSCSVTNSETEGPFPTITPATLNRTDITEDRTGIPLDITITVVDTNNNCTELEGAIVDIWHCDKDGNYSQYGGTQMQATDYSNYTFLRGRQVTNSDGIVGFTSIFPGWYQGRATHIHVHIYNASGTSLLVTQIAFPEGSNSAVVQVNSATAYGYTKGMSGYTYNAQDNIFSDGTSNEMSTITGSIEEGFELTHTIKVAN